MYHFELRPARRQSPWGPDVDKIFDAFAMHDTWTPACEILDGAKAYRVALDVPGLKKEDIEIELKDRELRVSGVRQSAAFEETDKMLKQERRYGRFQRVFSLPDGIDESGVSAQFEHGVLTITLPKTSVTGRKVVII